MERWIYSVLAVHCNARRDHIFFMWSWRTTHLRAVNNAKISLWYGWYGIEARSQSLSGDNTRPWVVISRGLKNENFGRMQTLLRKTQFRAPSGSVADMAFATKSNIKAEALFKIEEPSILRREIPYLSREYHHSRERNSS